MVISGYVVETPTGFVSTKTPEAYDVPKEQAHAVWYDRPSTWVAPPKVIPKVITPPKPTEKPTEKEEVKISPLSFLNIPSPFGIDPKVKEVFESVVKLGKVKGRKERIREEQLIQKWKSGQKLSQWERQKLVQLGYIQKVSKGKGMTQRYYETFGVKFYEPGERRRLKEEAVKPFTEAETFEEQKKAIKELKARGIPVKKEKDFFIVDTSAIAPTSKYWNLLVGTTDILAKSILFGPYLKTGALKKKELTARQQLELFSKQVKESVKTEEVAEKGEMVISKVEKVWIKKGVKGAEKEVLKLLKQAKTPEARKGAEVILRSLQAKGIIREYYFDIQTGEVQFGKISQPLRIKPKIEVEISGRVPTIKKVPEIISSIETGTKIKSLGEMETKFKTGVLEKPSQKFIPTTKTLPKQKPETKIKQIVTQKISQISEPKTKVGISEKVIQKQKLKQPEALIQTFKIPFGKPLKPRIEKPSWKVPLLLILFDKRKRQEPQRIKTKYKMPKATTRYLPTFGARWLGLKAFKISKRYKLGMGATMVRGILQKTGKKRRKKK